MLGKIEEKKEGKKTNSGGRKDKSAKKLRTESNKADNRYVNYYMNYTTLNAPVDHIFMVNRDKSIFGEPDVIRQDRSKRDARKFCSLHKDIRHDTNRCNSLKDVIEGLIRRGYFRHFIEAVDNARNDERCEHTRRSESIRRG